MNISTIVRGVACLSLAGSIVIAGVPEPARVHAATALCGNNKEFVYSTTSNATTADERARAANAVTWLKSMMQPLRSKGDGSTVKANGSYAYSYNGAVSGTFSVANAANYPIINGATGSTAATTLAVTSPNPIPAGYRGVVSGTTSSTGSLEVRAYLYTDTEYYQPSATPATVNADGTWSINLAPVDTSYAGTWHFRLYDKTTGLQIGSSWPQQGAYKDLVIQSYVVTDSPYLQNTQPASASNSWSFASTGTGHKMFRLVDTSTNTILGEYYNPATIGLIRSYEYLPGQDGYGTSRMTSSYMYDQALALMTAVGAGDKAMADQLLNGLRVIQVQSGTHKGAFPSSVDQINYQNNANPSYYTGGNAFVVYSLLRYYEKYGNQGTVSTMISNAMTWLGTMKTSSGGASGLYRGGAGIQNGSPYQITWYSTEHNTDLWHVYERAGRVLANATYDSAAQSLSSAIVTKLWNTTEKRFNQGYNDTGKALDTAGWGAVFLAAINDTTKAQQSLTYTNTFFIDRGTIKGYTPYASSSSVPTVWFEGTYGVALGYKVNGQPAQSATTLANTTAAQATNGAWPYALDADLANGRTNANSVASTAWYTLASVYPGTIWSECRLP